MGGVLRMTEAESRDADDGVLRLGFDGTALGSGRGGDETHCRGSLRGSAQPRVRGDQVYVHAYRDQEIGLPARRWTVPALPGAARYVASLPGDLWRHRNEIDLYHAHLHAPVWSPVPVALTVTDLSFVHHPELFPRATRVRLQIAIGQQVRRVALVVASTDGGRHDLIQHYDLEPSRVAVVPCAVEPPLPLSGEEQRTADAELARLGVHGPMVIHIGTLHPRKNVVRLIEAWQLLQSTTPECREHQLVLAGGRWWGAGAEEAAIRRARPGSVVALGPVDDTMRRHLLHRAAALAYPSLFEGFGLPPVEAMACGTPVLGTTRGAVPEVCGDAALLVDPLDIEAIADGLRRVLLDDSLRDTLTRAGRGQVEQYSLERVGHALRRAYRSVLEPQLQR